MFSVTWHFSVWVGWALVFAAAFEVQPQMGDMPTGFWVIAALVLLGELTPVMTAGASTRRERSRRRPSCSRCSTCGASGPPCCSRPAPAVVSETVKRKESWKLFFNVGQYAISLSAAWGVMWLFGVQDGVGASVGRPAVPLAAHDLVWIVLTWVVWFCRQQHPGRRGQRRRGADVPRGLDRGPRPLRGHATPPSWRCRRWSCSPRRRARGSSRCC